MGRDRGGGSEWGSVSTLKIMGVGGSPVLLAARSELTAKWILILLCCLAFPHELLMCGESQRAGVPGEHPGVCEPP